MKKVTPLAALSAGIWGVCLILLLCLFGIGRYHGPAAGAAAPKSTLENQTAEIDSAQEASVPELTLLGDTDMTVTAGYEFTDPGCTAKDAADGDLTSKVTVDGTVDPRFPGDYTLTYQVTNSAGKTASASRTVQIEAPEKVVYLTFDDGPSEHTQQLLDVLDKYHVNATFFCVNVFSQYQDMIAKEAAAGNSVGIHSYTHDYNKIYASTEAYFEDLDKEQAVIKKQTGKETKLIRFPGGSSNTISAFNPGIMTTLTQLVQERGYQYFDWNVASGDAGDTTETDVVVQNVIDGLKEHNTSVVLMHDSLGYSVDGVEQILKWGLENGYTFLPLCYDSPAAHHPVNN